MYTADDLKNVLGLLEFAWQNGGVRSEGQGVAFSNLRVKTQQLLNPNPAAPTPPAGDEKKKKGDCCGGEKKEEKKPDGPPKAGG